LPPAGEGGKEGQCLNTMPIFGEEEQVALYTYILTIRERKEERDQQRKEEGEEVLSTFLIGENRGTSSLYRIAISGRKKKGKGIKGFLLSAEKRNGFRKKRRRPFLKIEKKSAQASSERKKKGRGKGGRDRRTPGKRRKRGVDLIFRERNEEKGKIWEGKGPGLKFERGKGLLGTLSAKENKRKEEGGGKGRGNAHRWTGKQILCSRGGEKKVGKRRSVGTRKKRCLVRKGKRPNNQKKKKKEEDIFEERNPTDQSVKKKKRNRDVKGKEEKGNYSN